MKIRIPGGISISTERKPFAGQMNDTILFVHLKLPIIFPSLYADAIGACFWVMEMNNSHRQRFSLFPAAAELRRDTIFRRITFSPDAETKSASLPPISVENPVAPPAIIHTLFSLQPCYRAANHAELIRQM